MSQGQMFILTHPIDEKENVDWLVMLYLALLSVKVLCSFVFCPNVLLFFFRRQFFTPCILIGMDQLF